MQNTYLFGFATFGHPNDFRQSAFKFENFEIANTVKTFDLPHAIKVFPKSTIYAIRKENVDGLPGISYAVYTFAQEMHSKRDGTFIGSSILFTNQIAEENITLAKLKEFHKILVATNTENDILKVNHSKDFGTKKEFLTDFEKIAYHLKPIKDLENFILNNNSLVIGSRIDDNTLTNNFKKALLLLNKFDTIYFTSSREVIDYCNSKNIFKVTDEKGFEIEILNFQEAEKLKVLNCKKTFEAEKQKMELEKRNWVNTFKAHVEKNEKIQKENQKTIENTKNQIGKLQGKYDGFIKEIDVIIAKINSSSQFNLILASYQKNKQVFINELNGLSVPLEITKVSEYAANAKIETSNVLNQNQVLNKALENDDDYVGLINGKFFKKIGIVNSGFIKRNFFKILSFVFAVFWLATMCYFLIFNEPIHQKSVPKNKVSETVAVQASKKEVELVPTPNSELNLNDKKIISKQNIKGLSLDDIVKIIFEKNPTEIGKVYKDQKEVYAQILLKQNPSIFENNICQSDSLIHVPSFKNP